MCVCVDKCSYMRDFKCQTETIGKAVHYSAKPTYTDDLDKSCNLKFPGSLQICFWTNNANKTKELVSLCPRVCVSGSVESIRLPKQD